MAAKPMNARTLDMVAERFRVLGDPSRLRLLQALAEKERTVADLTAQAEASQANVSKHLGVLLRAGLVARRKEGLFVYYRLADPRVLQMCDLMCGSIQAGLATALSAFEPARAARPARAKGGK